MIINALGEKCCCRFCRQFVLRQVNTGQDSSDIEQECMHVTFQVSDLEVLDILFSFLVSSRRPSPYNPSFALFLTLRHTTEHYVFLYKSFILKLLLCLILFFINIFKNLSDRKRRNKLISDEK